MALTREEPFEQQRRCSPRVRRPGSARDPLDSLWVGGRDDVGYLGLAGTYVLVTGGSRSDGTGLILTGLAWLLGLSLGQRQRGWSGSILSKLRWRVASAAAGRTLA